MESEDAWTVREERAAHVPHDMKQRRPFAQQLLQPFSQHPTGYISITTWSKSLTLPFHSTGMAVLVVVNAAQRQGWRQRRRGAGDRRLQAAPVATHRLRGDRVGEVIKGVPN